MKELRSGPAPGHEIDSDERWLLAQRIAQSEPFRRSPRLRTFLLYIVERVVRDHATELGEHEIGVEVFGRSSCFNPSEDSIVRTSARQLRAKLQEYFESAQNNEKLRIVVPKGGYVPEFGAVGPRSQAEVPQSSAASEAGRLRRALIAVSLLCVVMAAAAVYSWKRSVVHTAAAPQLTPRNLLSTVLSPYESDVNLVLCDSALVIVNSVNRRILSLDEYIRYQDQKPLFPTPPSVGLRPLDFPGKRLITSFRDVAFAQQLEAMWSRTGRNLSVRHSRMLQVREFRAGNFILLGSTWSNPWMGLFEPQLNFRFETEKDTSHFIIRNQSPRSGEKSAYWSSPEESRNGESYARIALVPNLSGSGKVLLLSGEHPEGSEATCDASLSADFLAKVENILSPRRLNDLTSFELLIRAAAVDGVVKDKTLVAYRFSGK